MCFKLENIIVGVLDDATLGSGNESKLCSADAVMSDDAILLKLEEDYTCPITQACLLTCTVPFLQECMSLCLTAACSLICLSEVCQDKLVHCSWLNCTMCVPMLVLAGLQ